jgi:aminoglycoside phosphotransferase
VVDVAFLRARKNLVIDTRTFEAWWSRSLEWVDEPNRRGRGVSRTGTAQGRDWPELGTIGRIFVKRQQAFYCRPLWNAGRRTPTLRREYRYLEYCRARDISVPRVLGYAEDADRAVLLLAEVTDARSFEHALDADPSARELIIRNVLALARRLHAARVRHGALHPKHLLVANGAEHAVSLIDLEKARLDISRRHAARRDIAQLLRHAAFLTDRERLMVVDGYVADRLLSKRDAQLMVQHRAAGAFRAPT